MDKFSHVFDLDMNTLTGTNDTNTSTNSARNRFLNTIKLWALIECQTCLC